MNLPRWAAAVVAALALSGCAAATTPTELPSFPVSSTTPPVSTTPSPTPPALAPATSTPSTTTTTTTTTGSRSTLTVARFIDGDTVKMSDGRTIRVLGVDTAETVAPGQAVECFGPEGSAFAKRFLAGPVTVSGVRGKPDRYGRTLANLGTSAGDYGLAAVSGGYARVYRADTTPALRAAEADARKAKRGLWGACPATSTTTPARSTTTPPPSPRAAAGAGVPFPSCAAARAAGAAPLRRGQPGYSTKLDGDRDGVACE